MWEVVARRCSAKKLFKKFYKIHREIPMPVESLFNTVATLLNKRETHTGVSERAVHRCSTE